MSKKVQNAWAFYDWANSVYSLVISTAIFPIYFESVTSVNEQPIDIDFLGFQIPSTSLYSYSIAFSFLIVAIISPFLSGIADYTGSKKKFLGFFCTIGSLACISLFFFTGDNIYFGLWMFIIAGIGFWGSLVFYNAFLPEIAPPEKQDALSAKGFSLGYIGASLLLIAILLMVTFHDSFGFSDAGAASRFSFILVGLWWFGFAQITLRKLPSNPFNRKPGERYIWNGFKEMRKVWTELKTQQSLRRFLYSFLFYSMGVQTVIMLASLYGTFLGIDTSKLILTILIIQFVAIGGAYLFTYLSKKFGNLQSIKISILIWAAVCFAAYSLTKGDPSVEYKFYAIGAIVGLVMGGIQSVSRSTYSKMLKENTQSHASYFSFYDVTEKIAVVFGTAIFGLLISLSDGDMKMSALALTVFFVIGFILMMRVKRTKHVR